MLGGTHGGQNMKIGVIDSCERINVDWGKLNSNIVEE